MGTHFPDGEHQLSYTDCLQLSGYSQEQTYIPDFSVVGSYSDFTSATQTQSPHLSGTPSVPATTLPLQSQMAFPPLASNAQLAPRSYPSWPCPSPPPALEEPENYILTGSDNSTIKQSRNSPGPWSPLRESLQQPAEILPLQQQGQLGPLGLRTPSSTDGVSPQSSQMTTPYNFTGGIDYGIDGITNEMLRQPSPASLPSYTPGFLSATASPTEPPMELPPYMAATAQIASPPEMMSDEAASPPGRPEGGEARSTALGGPKSEEPYAQLIHKAFMSRPDHAMTLQEIYQWFRENTDKANSESKGWQNSIRHNLSMNAAFVKRNKSPDGSASPSPTSNSNKRSTEWVLQQWAVEKGVQSTTRYRSKENNRNRRNGSDSSRPDHRNPPYHRGVQHHGQSISTRAISGRRGGCAASRARVRNRHVRLGRPTSHHGPERLPRSVHTVHRLDPYTLPAQEWDGLTLGSPHHQVAIKREQDAALPLTPETPVADSFALMMPEPSLVYPGPSVGSGSNLMATNMHTNMHTNAYLLPAVDQGGQQMYHQGLPGVVASDYPFTAADVTGIYEPEQHGVIPNAVSNDVGSNLFEPDNQPTDVLDWKYPTAM